MLKARQRRTMLEEQAHSVIPQPSYMSQTDAIPTGPPECYILQHQEQVQDSQNPVTQSVDIWSLGCVFSIAATWAVHGKSGLEQFSELRRQAINDIVSDDNKSQQPEGFLRKGDYFHDGRGVLSAVVDWHKYLRSSLRRSDRFTEQVLNLVDQYMLLSDPKARISAPKLCEALKSIESRASSSTGDKDSVVAKCVRDAIRSTELRWESENIAATQSRIKEGTTSSNSRLGADLTAHGSAGARRLSSPLPQMQISHRIKDFGSQSFIITSRGLMPGTTEITSSSVGPSRLPERPPAVGHPDSYQETQQSGQAVKQPVNPQSSDRLSPATRVPTNKSAGSGSGSSTSSTKKKLSLGKLFKKKETGDENVRYHFEGRDIVRHLRAISRKHTDLSQSYSSLIMAQVWPSIGITSKRGSKIYLDQLGMSTKTG